MEFDLNITQMDYTLFVRDAVKYSKRVNRGNIKNRDPYLLAAIVIVFVVLFQLTEIRFDPLLLLLGSVLGFSTLFLVFSDQRRYLAPDKNGFILGPCSYRLSNDGFEYKREGFRSATEWHTVRHIFETGQHIYFFLDNCAACILPKRDFSDGELNRLKEELQKHNPEKWING